MDMVVNIFVLSFCYVLYMRKERTLSRSNKKPSDEFSPSAPEKEFAYLHAQFFPRFRIRVEGPDREGGHKTTLKNSKFKKEKNSSL